MTEHYLRLYKSAGEILDRPGNPCNIKVHSSGLVTCHVFTTPNAHLCCVDCEHLGPNGCTVQALGCRLAWCVEGMPHILGMREGANPAFAAIRRLKDEAVRLGLPVAIRQSMEQAMVSQ